MRDQLASWEVAAFLEAEYPEKPEHDDLLYVEGTGVHLVFDCDHETNEAGWRVAELNDLVEF